MSMAASRLLFIPAPPSEIEPIDTMPQLSAKEKAEPLSAPPLSSRNMFKPALYLGSVDLCAVEIESKRFLAGELDLAVLIDADALDQNLVTLVQYVGNNLDASGVQL